MNIVLLVILVIMSPYLAGLVTPYLMAGGALLLRAIIYMFALGFNIGARPFYYVFKRPLPNTKGPDNV